MYFISAFIKPANHTDWYDTQILLVVRNSKFWYSWQFFLLWTMHIMQCFIQELSFLQYIIVQVSISYTYTIFAKISIIFLWFCQQLLHIDSLFTWGMTPYLHVSQLFDILIFNGWERYTITTTNLLRTLKNKVVHALQKLVTITINC